MKKMGENIRGAIGTGNKCPPSAYVAIALSDRTQQRRAAFAAVNYKLAFLGVSSGALMTPLSDTFAAA